jgi:hypothetical protein
VGGPYYRASDPVAGIDLNGTVYLNTIASLDTALTMTAILVSRSTNGGVTFDPPREVARSPNASVFLDKNWMAVNTFAGTPTAGRLAVTWTRFAGAYYPIVSSVSDDGGQTWSEPTFVTPTNSTCQGSQPVFLPDGKLALVYWNFASQDPGFEYLLVALSADGGATYDYSNLVAKVQRYDAPGIRDGVFLPAATSCRTNNNLFVVYQGFHQSKPKILFTQSLDGGVTWSASVPVSDNDTTPVFNPTIGVSPDGQSIAVTFYDGRMNPTNTYLVDLYMAQSLDGGATWQPNERLTTTSSDARLAPLTASGYMLGDYMGVAPPDPPQVPAVPVWVDTRTGDPDPFATRVGISSNLTFSAWRAARFSLAEINQAQVGAPDADPDHDGLVNALEYAFGLNPRAEDQPDFAVSTLGDSVTATLVAKYQRLRSASDVLYLWYTSTNLFDWSGPASISQLVIPDNNPQFEDVTATLGTTSEPGEFFRLSVELRPN